MSDALGSSTILPAHGVTVSKYGKRGQKLAPVHFFPTFGGRLPADIIIAGEGFENDEDAITALLWDTIGTKFAAACGDSLKRDSKPAEIEKLSAEYTLTVKTRGALSFSWSEAKADAKKKGQELTDAHRTIWEFAMAQAHEGKVVTFTD